MTNLTQKRFSESQKIIFTEEAWNSEDLFKLILIINYTIFKMSISPKEHYKRLCHYKHELNKPPPGVLLVVTAVSHTSAAILGGIMHKKTEDR